MIFVLDSIIIWLDFNRLQLNISFPLTGNLEPLKIFEGVL